MADSKSPTGIESFDNRLEGGIPAGTFTLVRGSKTMKKTATMISILGSQALERNEKILHVTFTETRLNIIQKYLLELTGIDINKPHRTDAEENLIRASYETIKRNLKIVCMDLTSKSSEQVMKLIVDYSREFEAKNVIIEDAAFTSLSEGESNNFMDLYSANFLSVLAIKENLRVMAGSMVNLGSESQMSQADLQANFVLTLKPRVWVGNTSKVNISLHVS